MLSSRFYFSILLGLTFFGGVVAQAQLKVVEGEYLVRVASGQVGALSTSKLELVRKDKPQLGIFSSQLKVVDFDSSDSFCKDLISSGQAIFCEPNYYVEASVVSSDPSNSDLYGMGLIGAPQAWDISTGNANNVVAVIDTGVDYNHPDLAANIWTNPAEIAGNGIDDDGNGWIDDVHGINAYNNSGNPFDDNGHGTHVSGTIGAVGNNSLGVVGVNWNVKIMGLKFLGAGGGGSIFGAIKAIDYMIDAKSRYGLNLKVANNSWGGAGYSKALEDAILRAHEAGIIFVAAAGNDGISNDLAPSYPANYDLPNVISVAAVDSSQSLASFSNYGSVVDIAAPGAAILSTLPGGNYAKLSGTSMATPHVAGALALLSGYDHSLTSASLIERLYSSSSLVAGLAGKIRTGAMLNLAGMFGVSPSPIAPPSAPVVSVSRLSVRTGDGSSLINPGDALRISVTAKNQVSEAAIEIFLNDKKCEQVKVVSLNSGVNKFRAKVSSIADGIKNLSVKVGNRRVKKSISSGRYSRRISAKAVSARNLQRSCDRISKTIR